MNKIKLTFLCFLLAFKSFACLNGESLMLKNGDYLYMDQKDGLPFGHRFSRGNFEVTLHKLDSLYKKTNDIAYLSDKGLVLILQKKYKEALELYLDIEKRKPNRYSTASNVGTTYELLGENEKALEWIKKAVRINPKSHYGSEWIHVNILEAKIKGKSYFTGKFLLNTDFGNDTEPQSNYDKAALDKLDKALYYQLNERISFIEPKDPIIAELLFQLGNVKLLKKNFRDGTEILKKAKEYGLNSPLLDKRIAYAQKFLPKQSTGLTKNRQEISPVKTTALTFSVVLGAALVFFSLRRNRK